MHDIRHPLYTVGMEVHVAAESGDNGKARTVQQKLPIKEWEWEFVKYFFLWLYTVIECIFYYDMQRANAKNQIMKKCPSFEKIEYVDA